MNNPNETQLVLSGNLGHSKKINTLRMSCMFVVEKQRQRLEIPDVVNVHNATYTLAGYRMVLHDVNKVVEGRYAYKLSVFRDEKGSGDWEVFKATLGDFSCQLQDAQGHPLFWEGGGGGSGPTEVTMNNTFQTERGAQKTGPPATLVWEVPSKIEQLRQTIEFSDISLP